VYSRPLNTVVNRRGDSVTVMGLLNWLTGSVTYRRYVLSVDGSADAAVTARIQSG